MSGALETKIGWYRPSYSKSPFSYQLFLIAKGAFCMAEEKKYSPEFADEPWIILPKGQQKESQDRIIWNIKLELSNPPFKGLPFWCGSWKDAEIFWESISQTFMPLIEGLTKDKLKKGFVLRSEFKSLMELVKEEGMWGHLDPQQRAVLNKYKAAEKAGDEKAAKKAYQKLYELGVFHPMR